MTRRGVVAVAAGVALLVGVALPAVADDPDQPGELDPSEDNADPVTEGHCDDVVSPTGSRIIRRLVDGPRQEDGSLAFISGVCIYLPPGHDDGHLRYPVLYLLHGAFGWQTDWVAQGGMQQVMDDAYDDDPASAMIVVMPDGSYTANWQDDPSGWPLNETYVIDHVIPYVDASFRTIPDRAGRGIAGLSNGGAGTLRLASRNPDLFAAAAAMSAALPVNQAGDVTDVDVVANDPTEIADNLDDVALHLIWGLECGDPDACATYTFAWAFEQACCNNEPYVLRLQMVDRRTPFDYVATVGAHDWFYWTAWLRDPHGPFLRAHLLDPIGVGQAWEPAPVPESFRYRTTRHVFTIHGYDVHVRDRPATEFLALRDVTESSLTMRGSGQVDIATASRYQPGSTYRLSGHDDTTGAAAVADGDGRLSFVVDLGIGHTMDQYTPAQRAAELAGDYWAERTVEITLVDAPADAAPPGSSVPDVASPRSGPAAPLPATGGGAALFAMLALVGTVHARRRVR